jgi:hypothetical protein
MSKLALPVLSVILFCATSSIAAADALYRRSLACDNWTNTRERDICNALEREMEWTWTGHAILAPSFRVTFSTAKQVYCALPITPRDTRPLVDMVLGVERKPAGTMSILQIANGSRFLLYLLGESALKMFPARDKDWDDRSWQMVKNLREDIARDSGDVGMIWNKANPQYLLREGCR